MFEPSSLLPKKKPSRAFLARKGETPFHRTNEDEEDAELLLTAPKDSFEILDAWKPHTAPEYAYHVQAVYNEFGKNAVLIFRHQIIKIYGENLQDLMLSIHRKTCICIQVFTAERHEQPKADEAIVRKVEVEGGNSLEDIFLEMDRVIQEYLSQVLLNEKKEQPEALPETPW